MWEQELEPLAEHRQQAGRVDCAHEEHRQEEQPAAQKDCGEQAILHVAELLADDADESQEGNPGKWHQVEAQPDEASSLRICLECLKATFRQGNTNHCQAGQEEHGKHDPRNPTLVQRRSLPPRDGDREWSADALRPGGRS
jgi:hypothetical protein